MYPVSYIIPLIGSAIASSWLPVFFVPAGMVWLGVVKWYNPRIVAIYGIIGGVMWIMSVLIVNNYILKIIRSKHTTTYNIPHWIKKTIDPNTIKKDRVFFLFLIVGVSWPIPDVITVWYAHRRVSRPQLLTAAIIGKAIIYIPLAFGIHGIHGIIQLL